MRLDPKKSIGTWTCSERGRGCIIEGLMCTHDGYVLPGQDIPAHLLEPVPTETAVEEPRLAPEPEYDDPEYAPEVKPKVYLTQMNMRQLRAECVELGLDFSPGEKKKALIAKIREARK